LRTCPRRRPSLVRGPLIDVGINFFDTSDNYAGGNVEKMLGAAIRRHSRAELVLCTKGGSGPSAPSKLDRRGLTRSLDGSLRRLRTDYVDLYLVHAADGRAPLEETLATLTDFVDGGKVRAIGWSNFSPELVYFSSALAHAKGLRSFQCGQVLYNLLWRTPEAGLLQACEDEGLRVVGYSPLCGGLLAGRYRSGRLPAGSRAELNARYRYQWLTPANLLASVQFSEVAARCGMEMSGLAIAWVLRKPVIGSAVAGATSTAQIRAIAKAVDSELSPEQLSEIDAWLDQTTAPPRRRGRTTSERQGAGIALAGSAGRSGGGG
jgi:aryl-alcohol dehydrogenase-like predicted oxidoreductase